MNTPTHTPGPWFLDTASDGSMAIMPQCGFTITVIKPRPGFEQDLPNARLMAAAPELLAALQALFEHCAMPHKFGGEGCNQKQADAAKHAGLAAIAKATAL